MDLRQLRHFVAVYDLGNFARAAAACFVSQPAISGSIAKLEHSLKVVLFERGAFGARGTIYARHLYPRAKLLLSEATRATHELEALHAGESGTVAVGIGAIFEEKIMPQILAAFVARRPSVSVSTFEGVTGELFQKLIQGDLDFSVSTPPGWVDAPEGIQLEILDQSTDVIIAADDHPLWRRGERSLAALARYPWVVSARVGEATRNFFLAFERATVRPPRKMVRTDSIPIIRELIERSGFLTVVSPQFVQTLQHSPRPVRVLPEKHFSFPRCICLARRSEAVLSPAAEELMALVRAACLKGVVTDTADARHEKRVRSRK